MISERCGKAHPCRGRLWHPLLTQLKSRSAGDFDGRYWARTSDPQLVDSRRPFAPELTSHRDFARVIAFTLPSRSLHG
jgi:hypothetical protein